MARRHPILTFVAIVLTIVALVHFSRSFDASATLARVQTLSPDGNAEHAPPGGAHGEAAKEAESLKGSAANTHDTPHDAHGDSLQGSVHDYPQDASHASPQEGLKDASQGSLNAHGPAAGSQNSAGGAEHDRSLDVSAAPIDELASGKPIMAKMKNQTIRAEVGRAGWKLLHTTLAQYPETPTPDDRHTLEAYLKLFSRVYPCRECAEHFQELLREYPPQLSSRTTAVNWGCMAHNQVNERLGKEIFDCAYISGKYDCGCGPDEQGEDASGDSKDAKVAAAGAPAGEVPKTPDVPRVSGG